MTATAVEHDGHEVELKLRIPAAAAASVLRHPAVAASKRGRARTTSLTSIYFDTPDRRLAQAGVAVRLRKAGRDWLQTVKGPATSGSAGGLHKRVECEWRIGRPARRPPLDLARLATTPYRRAIEKATRRADLAPVFTTRIERTSVPLSFADHTQAQLCVDRGVVHAGARSGVGVARQAIVEVEIELESGDSARLFDLALALAADLPISVETRSKSQRGYDLIAPQRAPARHAETIVLPRKATAAEAMAAVIRNSLRQLEVNADGVRSGDDPESVHQMRVGVRRLRSALALLRRVVPGEPLRTLETELKWLAGLLGRVRDLDVFALDTLAAMTSTTKRLDATDDAAQEAIALLGARAHAFAADGKRDARAAIASPRFTRLLLSTARLSSTPLLGARSGTPEGEVMQGPARRFAAKLLSKRHRRLQGSAGGLDGTADQRHQIRIQAKKMRYAAEFFTPLYGGKRARAYRKALMDVQQVLGVANDAATAMALASELAPDSPAAALVRGWTAAQLQAQDERLARAWCAFVSAKRFWTGPALDA